MAGTRTAGEDPSTITLPIRDEPWADARLSNHRDPPLADGNFQLSEFSPIQAARNDLRDAGLPSRSLDLIGAGHFAPRIRSGADHLLRPIIFDQTLMQGMLSVSLFAGARHRRDHDLGRPGWRHLRGAGVVVAPGRERGIVVGVTDAIVIFSILAQGPTLQGLVRRLTKP